MLSFNEVKPKWDKNGELVVIVSCKHTVLRLWGSKTMSSKHKH